MTNTTETLLDQLGGANKIATMTGAQIVTSEDYAVLVFQKQTGANKFTHLKVQYNTVTDSYDILTIRMNRKTCQMANVSNANDVNAADLKRTCEGLTGMVFSF